MEEILNVFHKACWCGVAALGFGILFNAPRRALAFIWLGGFVAGSIKFGMLESGLAGGIVSASFAAAVGVGFLSIPVAHKSHVPPVIFSIPSIIPLVPGVFAYRTMLGFMKLTAQPDSGYAQNLAETFQNATVTLFVIMAISLGVAVPMHIFRKKSAKNLRLLPGSFYKKGKNL